MSTLGDKPKITVLFSATGGGAQRSSAKIVRGLVERGYDIEVVVSRNEGPYMSFIPESVPVRVIGSKSPSASLKFVRQHFDQRKPDLVISNQQLFNTVVVLARQMSRAKPRLMLVQRNDVGGLAEGSGHPIMRFLPFAAKILWPKADAVVGVSEKLRGNLERQFKIPRSRTHTLYNPVIGDQIENLRHELPDHPWLTAGGVPVILAVGNLNKQKDHATLVRAFAKLRKKRDCRLLILGEGEERDNLARLVESLGVQESVSMPGYAPNPFAYMSNVAVVALSSIFEGLPNVVIEALACGAMVVATDCETGPREILKDGELGRLVPVGDPDQMAIALEAALDDRPDRERLRARALDFSEKASIDSYEELIKQMFQGGNHV